MSLLRKIRDHAAHGILTASIIAGAYSTRQEYGFPSLMNTACAQDVDPNEDAAIGKNVTKTARVPHYLRGVDAPKDPVLRLFEKWRMYNSLTNMYPERPKGHFVNESIAVKQTILGKELTLTFVDYVKKGGKVVHYTSAGQEDLTPEEFEVVVQDNKGYIETAAQRVQERFSQSSEKIKKTIEDVLRKEKKLSDDQKLDDILDNPIEGYEGLRVRDVLNVQEITVQDFIPEHYYFGPIPALGVTYLGIGVVGIDPKARILDHINGVPSIMMHEMIHNNHKIEGFPFALYFDAELWAEFPMLTDNDYLDFSLHPYLKDVRKLAKVLFNFNTRVAFEDIRDYPLVIGLHIEEKDDYKKLRGLMNTVQRISTVIQQTALDEFVPEFYAHPLYWMTVNDFLHDDAAAFKLYFYKKFEPTSLGGPEKTRKFMDENKDVVREESKKVLQELHEEAKNQKRTAEVHEPDLKELRMYLNSMRPEIREQLCTSLNELGIPVKNDTNDIAHLANTLHKLCEAGVLDKRKLEHLEKLVKK